MKADSFDWTEFYFIFNLYKSAEFGTFVTNEQLFVFILKGAVTSTDTDLLHYHAGVTVSADCYLIFSKAYQKYGETLALIFIVDAFEDGVGRIGCSVHVQ